MRSPYRRFSHAFLTAALFAAGLLFGAPRHAWAQG